MPIFYQREWNGVDLVDIAADARRLDGGVPNAEFYAEYYRRLRAGGQMPARWWATKRRNSELLVRWIAAAASASGRDPRQLEVVSIGAGLGVVELPLIEAGYHITLHEVQDESLQQARARAKGARAELDTVTGPLSTIHRSFEMAYLGTCEYCLPKRSDYLRFLGDVHRLVTAGGRVTALDYEPALRTYAAAAAGPFRGHAGIKWGRLRSAASRARALRGMGFEVWAYETYDENLVLTASSRGSPRPRLPLGGGITVLHAVRGK